MDLDSEFFFDWDSLLQPDYQDIDSESSSRPDNQPVSQTSTLPDITPIISVLPLEDDDVSISTAFYPDACLDPLPPDLIFVSADSVLFYIHSHVILGPSNDQRIDLLSAIPTPPLSSLSPNSDNDPQPSVVSVHESAAILNVILHVAYGISCARYFCSLDVLAAAVEALPKYGLDPKQITQRTPFYSVLLSHAPSSPLKLYILAAHHGLEDLAVATSSHLHSLTLSTITDDDAVAMGPVYLKRLFFLHLGRTEALRRVMRPPPHPHPPTAMCDLTEQRKLGTAWTLASSYIMCGAVPDLSENTIQLVFGPLGDKLTCDLCRHALTTRIRTLVSHWLSIKRTI